MICCNDECRSMPFLSHAYQEFCVLEFSVLVLDFRFYRENGDSHDRVLQECHESLTLATEFPAVLE